MNIGVIGIKGGWSSESLSKQLSSKQCGGAVIELQDISYDLNTRTCSHPDHDLRAFDAFIVKKMGSDYSPHLLDELELLEMLERQGYRFFSSPRSIRMMISRLSCTICLRDNDIPMPQTFITESVEEGVAWVAEHGSCILKPLYSTKARGMELLQSENEARRSLTRFKEKGEKVIYLQKKLELNNNDYGLVFLDGHYIGAYARVGDGSSWHTTTEKGGKYRAYKPPQAFIDIAERAQRPFGLDFTSVDVADSEELGPVVFEVSAFGGYKGLYESSGLDASDLVTNHVIEKLLAA
jgi:ribosomal protein S6--L-glutamate ligase